MDKPTNQSTGTDGEDLAVQYLEKNGYKILEKNYRTGRYEIDIICQKFNILVFVEVKTRRNAILEPELAVNRSKQRNIAWAAEMYMVARKKLMPVRFDIIAIHFFKGKTEIAHFEDAFYPVFYK